MAGAKHVNFLDFNQRSLAELIPDPNTRILIYCNNNFEGNPVDFTTKVFIPPTASDEVIDETTGDDGAQCTNLHNLYG